MLGVIVLAIIVVLILGCIGLVSNEQTKLRPGVRWFAIGVLVVLVLLIPGALGERP